MICTFLRTVAQIRLDPLPNSQKTTEDIAQKAWEKGLMITFGVLGAVALLMIVINGFLYITANGDAQKTVQARLGVLYSVIGLIVVIFAAAIVTFVAKGL